MKFSIVILVLLFISCRSDLDVKNDILKIEYLLQVKIKDKYEILEEENLYPFKADIIHFVVIQFSEQDYEIIYKAASMFFKKPEYDPLYPDQNLGALYYESEEDQFSVYINTISKQVYVKQIY